MALVLMLLTVYLVVAVLVARVAKRKGRNFGLWLLVGLMSPLVGIIAVSFLNDAGKPLPTVSPSPGTPRRVDIARRECPRCGEMIAVAAKMCRFCQLEFPEAAPGSPENARLAQPRPQCPRCSFFLAGGICSNCGYREPQMGAKPATVRQTPQRPRLQPAGMYSCHFATCGSRGYETSHKTCLTCGNNNYPL